MIILDTDIISLVQREESAEGLRVRARIAQTTEIAATTVVTYEEQIQGWFAAISRARKAPYVVDRELEAYGRLVKLISSYRRTQVFPYDRPAADRFSYLKSLRLRIGTNDLRIAAIVLTLNATLISRNLVDFTRVPKLRVEDWTKP